MVVRFGCREENELGNTRVGLGHRLAWTQNEIKRLDFRDVYEVEAAGDGWTWS